MNPTELCKELVYPHCRESFCRDDSQKGQSCRREPDSDECMGQSVCDAIESIALAEAALAHILNNEGEKLLKAIEFSENINDLLEISRSVNKTLLDTIQLEQAYCKKLDTICELYKMKHEKNHVPDTPYPSESVYSESAPGAAVFSSAVRYSWLGRTCMKLRQESCTGSGIALENRKYDSFIILSPGKKFKVAYEIELLNKYIRPVRIDMRLCDGNTILLSKKIFDGAGNNRPAVNDFFVLETPNDYPKYTLCILLQSPSCLRIINSKIAVSDI